MGRASGGGSGPARSEAWSGRADRRGRQTPAPAARPRRASAPAPASVAAADAALDVVAKGLEAIV